MRWGEGVFSLHLKNWMIFHENFKLFSSKTWIMKLLPKTRRKFPVSKVSILMKGWYGKGGTFYTFSLQVLVDISDTGFMKHSDECHVTMKEISIFEKVAKCIFLSQITDNPACSRKSWGAKHVCLLMKQYTAHRLLDSIWLFTEARASLWVQMQCELVSVLDTLSRYYICSFWSH